MRLIRPLWLACLLVATTSAASPNPITVFAAASLTDALNEINATYAKSSGKVVRASYAASSSLARQIEAGARADVFFSADAEWVDYLQARSLLDNATRRNILGNRLVMIAPADGQIELAIKPNFPLAAALGRSRLVTGDPDSVPVGRYARAALTAMGVWNDVAERVVRADNVRAALTYVARGEAALGIVYETDARIEKRVRVVDIFPADSHAPIVYPIVATRTAAAETTEYLRFVAGEEATAIFQKHGFSITSFSTNKQPQPHHWR